MRAALTCSVLLAALRSASADSTALCTLDHPLIATYEIAEGCPLVVYIGVDGPAYTPVISDTRGSVGVPIETTVQESTATLDGTSTSIDPSTCVETVVTAPAVFRVYTIDVAGAKSGDWLAVDGGSVPVLDAGPCAAVPLPMFGCQPDETCTPTGPGDPPHTQPGPNAADPEGCNAGGANGGLALAALALVGLRRRRRSAGNLSASRRRSRSCGRT